MERRLGEGSPCELVVKKLGYVWGALKTTQYNAEARLQSHNQANILSCKFVAGEDIHFEKAFKAPNTQPLFLRVFPILDCGKISFSPKTT